MGDSRFTDAILSFLRDTQVGGCEKDDLLREGGSQSIYTGPGLGLDPTGILLHPSPS